MVKRSDHNWEQHLVDVYTEIRKTYNKKYAEKFISFYFGRYNEYNRSFMDYKLAFYITNLYYETKRCGTRWIACLGIGGAGKTTIMKNIFYYLDPSIKDNQIKRIPTEILPYIKELKNIEKDSLKGMFMDEPDDSIHAQSLPGKGLRKILGKQRQHGFITGICATDVSDIPAYIWKKVHVLLFCPSYGKVWLFVNEPQKLSFPIQKIRCEIMQYGYDLLVNMKHLAYVFDSHARTPLDDSKAKYEHNKWNDYNKDIDDVIETLTTPKKNDKKIRNMKWKEARKSGVSAKTIAEEEGVHIRTVQYALKK